MAAPVPGHCDPRAVLGAEVPNKTLQGPLMLEMGVLPDVAAATSATMILFTSASAAVVFLSFGGVPPAYAGLSFGIGLLSTAAGQVRIRHGLVANHGSALLGSCCHSLHESRC